MPDFVMSARNVSGKTFDAEPGTTRFLIVPDDNLPSPAHEAPNVDTWVKQVLAEGSRKRVGDILIFIHGYNNGPKEIMKRHRRLKADLAGIFKCAVVSFDWPCEATALNYLEDRHDAKQTAMQLVSDCITLLAKKQTPDCKINVHLLGHSTGAYVIREAFDDADDASLKQASWVVSQIIFIGGDVSSGSLTDDDSSSNSLYRHCTRLTNYSNLHDSVLTLSNAKRLGMAPRVGRVGLPRNAPARAVNVDCSKYFAQLDSDTEIKTADQVEQVGTFCHSWHIGNRLFIRDLAITLRGELDRTVIPTRWMDGDGVLHLEHRKS